MNKRKPEWAPEAAPDAFASRVVSTDKPAVAPYRKIKRPKLDLDKLVEGIKEGNRSDLSRAITLVESNSDKHFEDAQELLKRLLPFSGNSMRIGITGVPGVGKSSFIESFGSFLTSMGKKVAVLAIDPSSTLSKGSILGDKTRMEELSKDPLSFIRPSPSSGVLGGVARKSRESIILCEAAGYEIILIETVGVGQSEITVRSMVDFFLLLQIAGAGDELQGIKKGIMELADHIVVNKADGDNVIAAKAAAGEYNNALHYLRNATEGWTTKAGICSAKLKMGMDEIWGVIEEFERVTKKSGFFEERRRAQTADWFEELLSEAVLSRFFRDAKVAKELPYLRKKVANREIPVVYAVSHLLEGNIFRD